MAKVKFVPPNLDNATPSMLIDEMGRMAMVENHVKKLRKFYKEAFFARLELDPKLAIAANKCNHSGEKFIAIIGQSYPERLNQKLLEEKYPQIFAECKVASETPTTTVRLPGKEDTTQEAAQKELEAIYLELGLADLDDED